MGLGKSYITLWLPYPLEDQEPSMFILWFLCLKGVVIYFSV